MYIHVLTWNKNLYSSHYIIKFYRLTRRYRYETSHFSLVVNHPAWRLVLTCCNDLPSVVRVLETFHVFSILKKKSLPWSFLASTVFSCDEVLLVLCLVLPPCLILGKPLEMTLQNHLMESSDIWLDAACGPGESCVWKWSPRDPWPPHTEI